jgi:hypothetical protein
LEEQLLVLEREAARERGDECAVPIDWPARWIGLADPSVSWASTPVTDVVLSYKIDESNRRCRLNFSKLFHCSIILQTESDQFMDGNWHRLVDKGIGSRGCYVVERSRFLTSLKDIPGSINHYIYIFNDHVVEIVASYMGHTIG